MPSHRTSRKLPKAASFPRRPVTRQSVQSTRLPPSVPSAGVKPDATSLHSSDSMNLDYSGHNCHSQINQQPHYGGGDRHVTQGLHTPHHNSSYSTFDTPVDLTGATLLNQSDYHNLANNLPQPGINSSFRQSQGNSSNGPSNSFNLSTPQHNPFTSSIGPQTPSHQTVSPEPHSQPPPPVPRAPFPSYLPRQPAAEVVHAVRSQNFRLDSTVCKKLAIEPALRNPEQRNPERVLNMGRRGNAEALLCQITGQEAANACKNCKRGHGPWSKCVVYPGLFYGSCSNCWFNASGARCTFQESNHHPLHQLYASMAPSYNNPFGPAPSSHPFGAGGPLTHNPNSSYGPGSAVRSRDGVSLGNIHFNRSVGASNGDDGGPVKGSTHPADIELVHPDAVREITEGMIIDSVTWGARARYLVRIQAAASELGMRLGEYEEFLARNNLNPEPYMGSALRLGHHGRDAEGDDEDDHHAGGSQSPRPMTSVEKRDADMSGSEDAEGTDEPHNGLRELGAASMS